MSGVGTVTKTEWAVRRKVDGGVVPMTSREQAESVAKAESEHECPIECVVVSREVTYTEWRP